MVSDKEITLGEFLRHERESRGITLEQVASTTKIGIRTLHALEADHYAELPAKPFIRGFVTSYCRFVGMDPADTLSRFDVFVNAKSLERPSRESGHSGYAFDKKDGEQQSRAILTVAIASFIGLGAIVLLFFKPVLSRHRTTQVDQLKAAAQQSPLPVPQDTSLPKPAEKKVLAEVTPPVQPKVEVTPPPLPEIVAPSPSPLPSALPSSSPPEEAAPAIVPPPEEKKASPEADVPRQKPGLNPEDPLDSGVGLKGSDLKYKLSCKMLEDNWVRYKVDDLPIRKFIVRKGRILVLRGKNQVVLQVSHPENVQVTYNGQPPVSFFDHPSLEEKKESWTLSFPKSAPFPFEKERSLPETVDPSPIKKAEEPAPETGPVR